MKKFAFIFLLSLFVASAFAGQAVEKAPQHDHAFPDPAVHTPLDEADMPARIQQPSEPLAIVELRPDHHLYFMGLPSTDGQPGTGVAEISAAERVQVVPAFGLEKVDAGEIFWAFTHDDVAVPEALALPASADKRLSRGWALDLMDRDDQGYLLADGPERDSALEKADIACNNTWFYNWVPDGQFTYEWINPDSNMNNSLWEYYCAVGNGGCCSFASRWRFAHKSFNVDAWRGYVCGRSSNNHSWYCTTASGTSLAYLTFLYRDSNNNGWFSAFNTDYPSDGALRTYAWYWSGSNWDWQVGIVNAIKGSDEFDIYVGWED